MAIDYRKGVVSPSMVSLPSVPAGHVRAGTIRVVGELIRTLGGDPDAAFRSANIDQRLLADPDNVLPIAVRGELMARAAQETQCEHFGLLLGDRLGIDEFGAPEEVMPKLSTVGSALEAFAASWLLHNPATLIFIRRSGDQASLGYAVTDGNIPGMPQLQEAAMAIARNIMRGMVGPDWCPTGVNLMRHEPRDSAFYAHFFGANCHFNTARSELMFPAATLDIRLKNAGAKDAGPAQPLPGDYDWSAYVKRVACRLLLQGECSQKRVAAALGISNRTLVRKLANCGANYQQLFEVVRFSASRSLIRETNLAFSEIAAALGYKEASSFTRAFLRWSGMSPAQWRKLKVERTWPQSGKNEMD